MSRKETDAKPASKNLVSTEIIQLRERAIEYNPHGIIITDITQPDNPIVDVNPAFERITGYTKEEVLGKNCRFLQGLDNKLPAIRRIRLALQENREEHVVLRNYKKNGTLFWNQLNIAPVFDAEGQVKYYVGIMIDITNQKILEYQLTHQATHDPLTGLPNRSLLLDRIQQAIIQAKHTKLSVGILFLDLDRFKLINDGLGHVIGDQLLTVIATRLLKSVDENCTVARIGGDEFVIVIPAIENENIALEKSKKILEELRKSAIIEGKELSITTSIGVSFYPKDGEDANIILRKADMSMYLAKENGRNIFQVYTAELNKKMTKRMMLKNDLEGAIERKEFVLYYQPLIDLSNDMIFGAEALIRWNHPELGLIAPQDFIPIIEEDGLIVPVGEWVLHEACAKLKILQDQGFPDFRISINLSKRQLQRADICEAISSNLNEFQLKPGSVGFEITESTLLQNTEETIEKLHQLKEIGVILSIDDFGTGYSSLNYLKRFPVDKLKIDYSFIQGIPINENNAAITVAIIRLAQSLKLKVLAEGVENKAQLNFLRENNCNEAQGFYFSQPVSSDEFYLLLQTHHANWSRTHEKAST
jgi:diguanylate cyclase (GGDEF)-like protein/PAS domain S-box-containing protein